MTQLSLTIPDTVDEQVADIEEQIAALKQRLDDVQRQRPLTCYHCLQPSVISTLTYIQTHWYEEPHGCTGGDRWHRGEGQFTCPHCGETNHILRSDETNSFTIARGKHAGIDKLQRYFAKTVDAYKD